MENGTTGKSSQLKSDELEKRLSASSSRCWFRCVRVGDAVRLQTRSVDL